MTDPRPYRPNVGICLINQSGLVWMGKGETSGPETVTPGHEWQMPQGGIEETEDIVEAAKRELWEETGANTFEVLAVTDDWWTYEFPAGYEPTGHKLDPFRGQKQKWVGIRFTGSDKEFDISASHTGEPQEFFEWKWMDRDQALSKAVEFKLEQYRRVFNAFGEFII
ncbi:MAG: RNA pyrophosphohydrolase [Pseudomonadota bacterium]